MTFTFYVVDEARMPPESARRSPAATPPAVVQSIRDEGGRWGSVHVWIDDFAEAFQRLDGYVGGKGLLPELAFSGSPHLILTGTPGAWRLGYFEASLVTHLYGAFRLQSLRIDEEMARVRAGVEEVYQAFLSALEEADERGFAVAIVHD
jgi:hypothetical protein